MKTYTWSDFDLRTAEKGDAIVAGHTIEYVEDITFRKTSRPNISRPEAAVTLKRYYHDFVWEDEPGAGFALDCFEDGSLRNDTDYEDFEELKTKEGLRYLGIRSSERTFNEPAVLKCEVCGRKVVLDMILTNTCENCGTDYNVSGQRLAPREQWGEETGESAYDIFRADHSINDRNW